MNQHNGRVWCEGITNTNIRMKACYDHLTNSAGFHEGDKVWLYHPTQTRGKLLKLQTTWEGP
jgi:hypothetical protein